MREPGAGAGEQRDREPPVAVQEEREDEFGAEALHEAGLDREQPPHWLPMSAETIAATSSV